MFPEQPKPTEISSGNQVVHANATITASGSMVFAGYGAGSVLLFVNVTAAPTGTSPTLQYTIQEVDPGDDTTTFGGTSSTTSITGTGTQNISLDTVKGGVIKVSWVIGGGTPSFTGVYATIGQGGAATGSSVKVTDGTNTAAVTAASALKVDGSAVTQPVSGTVTANIGTSGSLALDATLTGGTAKSIVRGGAKGATTAADVTSTAEGADHQAVDVQLYHGGAAKDPTAIRALTSADVVTAAQGTAAALAGYWPVRVTDGTNTMPTGDAVGRAIFQKITDGTNTAAVKAASTLAAVTDPALVVALSPNNTPFQFGGDDRLKVGSESIIFFDTFEGAAIDTRNWTQSQSGMTQTVANTGLLLNAASSLTSGNYSIATSTKNIRGTDEFGLYFQYRSRIITRPNAVVEFGRGNVATTAAPTDAVLFRVPSGGQLQAVLNFGGSETVTQLAAAGAFNSTDYYGFEIELFEDQVIFEVYAAGASVPTWTATVAIPATQAAVTASANLPMFARVYNSALVTTPAAQLYVGNVVASAMDSGPVFTDASSTTTVASSGTNVTLLAANPNRKSASIFNESNQILYVKFGVTASATSYKYRVTANTLFEFPLGVDGRPWTGQVDGIWASANGNARISEEF